MTLLLNGAPQDIAGKTLAEALAELGYAGRIVATAVNGEFVPARKRAETALKDGDRIEVVAPMQGG
jgi:sulfur carrier protein